MKIKSLHIKNFKSIVDLTINEPNPFTVFVGPNGSGKSNIFEALEFAKLNLVFDTRFKVLKPQDFDDRVINVNEEFISIIENIFGGNRDFINKNSESREFIYKAIYDGLNENIISSLNINYKKDPIYFFGNMPIGHFTGDTPIYDVFYRNFSRIFLTYGKNRNPLSVFNNDKLDVKADNLASVLKNILSSDIKKSELEDWLDLFIPEFAGIETITNDNKENKFLIYSKYYDRPFDKFSISDGTFNIIALLTAVYQSDEPQFLCIEEPENGLNPKVVKELVNFFRDACEEKGHYIWLNTHSQTLVSQLKEEEMIVVDKINGETTIKQFEKGDFYGMPADEALLTNALGGGLPW